jgi:hypothetical protein
MFRWIVEWSTAVVIYGEIAMAFSPPSDPLCADQAPVTDVLTEYNYEYLVTYLRVLDADGADWQEVARIVLHIDPLQERARIAFMGKPSGSREMDD